MICSELLVIEGFCNSTQIGTILANKTSLHAQLLNDKVEWGAATNDTLLKFKYQVNETGFYCTLIMGVDVKEPRDFTSTALVKNPYGLLDGYLYPALPFYRTMSVIYSIIGIGWMTVSFLYWKDLLPIQHYVSFVIAIIVTEMAINYGFFESYNQMGTPCNQSLLANFLLSLMTILNSGRVSASFYMLLIVSLGFGVVKPTLGTTMNACIALGIIHFIFNAAYNLVLRMRRPNSTLEIMLAVPLSIIMTTFYMWILNGIEETKKHLKDRRQGIKLQMYTQLYWILFAAVIGTFAIFVANAINISHRLN